MLCRTFLQNAENENVRDEHNRHSDVGRIGSDYVADAIRRGPALVEAAASHGVAE